MRLLFFFFMLLATVATAQKRILVTDKVDVKDSIRLRGKSVAEISRDSQFLAPTHFRVPTQKAVRDFVNDQLGNVDVDSLVKAATASGFLTPNSLPYVDANGRVDARGFVEFGALGSAPSAPSAGFRFFGDASGRPSWRRADGFVRTFDAASITGDRVYTLQDATGTLAMLGVAQTWTGVQTFAPSGSGGSGFTVQGTARFSMPVPVATDAQIGALTGNVLGGWMVSSTQSRPYFYNGSAYMGVMLGPQGGIGNGVIPIGSSSGNLVSDGNLSYLLGVLYTGHPSGGTAFQAATNISTGQGFRIKQVNADGRSQATFYDSGGEGQILAARPTYAGGVFAFGPSSNLATNSGVSGHIIAYAGRLNMVSMWIGNGQTGNNNLVIAGAGQTIGYTGGTQFGGSGFWDIGTNKANSGTLSGVRDGLRFNASSFQFHPTSTSGNFVANQMFTVSESGVHINSASINSALIFDISGSAKAARPFPQGTDLNIAAISSPPVGAHMFSTTKERTWVKITGSERYYAYTSDVKRDTTYRVLNSNLDLSSLTTFFKNNYHTIRVATIVTTAATGNNSIIMPVPSVDLLGINFKVSVEDTSGDGDLSVLSFGTDGADGYLYNGDGTYASSQNLFPGLGVYLSVAWCEAKSAYRWVLQ